jgi:dynein light chain Tctex-type 1
MSSEKYTVQDEAADIVRDVCTRIITPEPSYDHKRVPQLVSDVIDEVMRKLTSQSRLARKYIVQCTIVQKNGAGIHSIAACSWNQDSDGSYVYSLDAKAMICIVTVFGVTM